LLFGNHSFRQGLNGVKRFVHRRHYLRGCKVGGNMTSRVKGAWILAGLAALGSTLVVGGKAEAASTVAAIVIKGGAHPGPGDPPWDYDVQVFLEPVNHITAGDSFTIDSLRGVTPANFPAPGAPASPTTQPSNPPSIVWTPSIGAPTNTTFPYASDLTWTFAGNTNINATELTQGIFLGVFTVQTTSNFTSPPYPNDFLIDYSYSVDGRTNTGTGTFPLQVIVPEPSSMVLLLVGAGALPWLLIRERRRRSQQQTAA
jgi:hypothetical protein